MIMPPRRLSPEAQEHAKRVLDYFTLLRNTRALSEQEMAAEVVQIVNKDASSEFRYDSPDRLYQQLADWGIPEFLFREPQPEPSETVQRQGGWRAEAPPRGAEKAAEPNGSEGNAKGEAATVHEPGLFGSEPGEELPDAADATHLFRMIQPMLSHYIRRIAHLKEFRDRGYFKAFGYYPDGRGAPRGVVAAKVFREAFEPAEWAKRCAERGEDPEAAEWLWEPVPPPEDDVAYPRGIMPHPAPEEGNLIAMYLLCFEDDDAIDALLKKLHQDRENPEAVGAAREQVKRILVGTKDRPGLLDRTRQTASAVRGDPNAGGPGLKGGAPIAWVDEEEKKRFGGVPAWWHDTLLDIDDMRHELGEDTVPHPAITRMLREKRGLTEDWARAIQEMTRRGRW